MKGASGAGINLQGDFVLKECKDAKHQVSWFKQAKAGSLLFGIRTPFVEEAVKDSYRMEYIHGHMATSEPTILFIDLLLRQIDCWKKMPSTTSGTWADYLKRLEDHVRVGPSSEMKKALTLLERSDPFPSSFCHGDLTFENILIEPNGTLVLIDPNYKPNLFQSYVLDLGKLLQSTVAGYHETFGSNHGVSLSRHTKHLRDNIESEDIAMCSLALLSHIIRLRKYRPPAQHHIVDQLLSQLTNV